MMKRGTQGWSKGRMKEGGEKRPNSPGREENGVRKKGLNKRGIGSEMGKKKI